MTAAILKLWWASLPDFDGRFEKLEACLPADERRRAERFLVPVARHRFVVGRNLLRSVLGTMLDRDPATLVFAAGDRGKPRLVTPEPVQPPGFNLSHSGNAVVLGIAPTEVGVDVERLREIGNAERLAGRFYSPAEQAAVVSTEGDERDRAFLRIWTQKEAYLKATGLGVGMPLRDVETEPDPTRPPRLLSISGDRDEAARWSLAEAEIPDAACIVALAGPPPVLDLRNVTSLDDIRT